MVELTLSLGEEVARLAGHAGVGRAELERALADGRARERFDRWAELQGTDPAWLRSPRFELAPVEVPIHARRAGRLARVATRQIGLLLVEGGGGRSRPDMDVDLGVSLEMRARLGDAVENGQELARVYLRKPDERLARLFADCFTVEDDGEAPVLILEKVV